MNRKKLYLQILSALFLSALYVPQAASAADFRAGIYSYMAWWKPSFRSIYNYKTDPIFMIGPMLSLTAFDDFTFSGIGMTNFLWPTDKSYTYTGTGDSGEYTISTPEKGFLRFDLDLSLSYTCTPWLKAFIGYKLSEFKEDHDDIDFKITSPYTTDFPTLLKNEAHSGGPGAGISLAWPVFNHFILNMSTSVVYLEGWFRMNSLYSSGTIVYKKFSTDESEKKYHCIGNSSNISLIYIIPAFSTAISLGGRFQVLKNFSEGDTPDLANDYYYGLTLSVLYTF